MVYSNKSKEEWDKEEENRRLAKQAIYNSSFGGDSSKAPSLESQGKFNPYDRDANEARKIERMIKESNKSLESQMDNRDNRNIVASVSGTDTDNPLVDTGLNNKDNLAVAEATAPNTLKGIALKAGGTAVLGKGVKNLAAKAAKEELLKKGTASALSKGVGVAGAALEAKSMLSKATTGAGASGNTQADVASGAVTGAMAGATFGVPGAAVGAVLGGIAGGLGASAKRKKDEKDRMYKAKLEGIEENKAHGKRVVKLYDQMKEDFKASLNAPRRQL